MSARKRRASAPGEGDIVVSVLSEDEDALDISPAVVKRFCSELDLRSVPADQVRAALVACGGDFALSAVALANAGAYDGADEDDDADDADDASCWVGASQASDSAGDAAAPACFATREDLLGTESLTCRQALAIKRITSSAKALSEAAKPRLLARLLKWGYGPSHLQQLLRYIQDDAPVIVHLDLTKTLHFIVKEPQPHLRNLFEVHAVGNTSGGCNRLDARSRWEARIFRGAYDGAAAAERVKYGSLNLVRDPCGIAVAAKQYGKSYVQLRSSCRLRATYADQDTSHVDEVALASCEDYAHILLRYSDEELRAVLEVALGERLFVDSDAVVSVYKEVQLHGPICLERDAQAIIVHPSHRGSAVLAQLDALRAKTGVPWLYMPDAAGNRSDATKASWARCPVWRYEQRGRSRLHEVFASVQLTRAARGGGGGGGDGGRGGGGGVGVGVGVGVGGGGGDGGGAAASSSTARAAGTSSAEAASASPVMSGEDELLLDASSVVRGGEVLEVVVSLNEMRQWAVPRRMARSAGGTGGGGGDGEAGEEAEAESESEDTSVGAAPAAARAAAVAAARRTAQQLQRVPVGEAMAARARGSAAAQTVGAPRWEWCASPLGLGTWTAYEDDVQVRIEQAFARGDGCEVLTLTLAGSDSAHSTSYVISLANLHQRNERSAFARLVRRALVPPAGAPLPKWEWASSACGASRYVAFGAEVSWLLEAAHLLGGGGGDGGEALELRFDAGPESGEQHEYVATVTQDGTGRQKKLSTGFERSIRRVECGFIAPD
jgi:hypothetical protein